MKSERTRSPVLSDHDSALVRQMLAGRRLGELARQHDCPEPQMERRIRLLVHRIAAEQRVAEDEPAG